MSKLFPALSLEKTAAIRPSRITLMPPDLERWPAKILESLYTQNPWLEPYAAELEVKAVDPEERSMVGQVLVFSSSPSEGAAEDPITGARQGQPSDGPGAGGNEVGPPRRVETLPVRLPFVVRSGDLYPLNLMLAADESGSVSIAPLTEDRFTASAGSDAPYSPSTMPDGIGTSSADVYGQVYRKLSGWVAPEDRLRVVRGLMEEGASDSPLLRKVAALETLPEAPPAPGPDLVLLERTARGVDVKLANSRMFAGVGDASLTMGELSAWLGAHGAERAVPQLDKLGACAVISAEDLEPHPILLGRTPALPALPEFSGVKTARVSFRDGSRVGLVADTLTGSGDTLRIFVGADRMSFLDKTACGAFIDGPPEGLRSEPFAVGSEGVFLSLGGMTEPLRIDKIAMWPDRAEIEATPSASADARKVKVTLVGGIDGMDVADRAYVISKDAAFLNIGELRASATAELGKAAALSALQSSARLISSAPGDFTLSGISELGPSEGMTTKEATFRLMLLGVELEAARGLLKAAEARRGMEVSFLPPRIPTPADTPMAKTAEAALALSREVYALRPEDTVVKLAARLCVKQGSVGPLPAALARKAIGAGVCTIELAKLAEGLSGIRPEGAFEDLLSLTFLNPENIAEFVREVPKIEAGVRLFAKMLYASYLGLDLNASDLNSAMGATDRVLDGLKKVRMVLEASSGV